MDWRYRRFTAAGNRFRERRIRRLTECIGHKGESILDVGYGYGQFEEQLLQLGIGNRVIALDIAARDVSRHAKVAALVVADAACLPIAGRSIDPIYCCNSVLERDGDGDAQRHVFGEIERVGCKFFVQTPNRRFPIEVHHLLPLFQYWPPPVQRWVGRNVLGHYEQVWLLGREAIAELADTVEGVTIWEEKALGLSKSFVLSRGHPSRRSN